MGRTNSAPKQWRRMVGRATGTTTGYGEDAARSRTEINPGDKQLRRRRVLGNSKMRDAMGANVQRQHILGKANLADSRSARKGKQTFDSKSRTITRRRNGVITTGVLGPDGKLIPSSVKRTTELQPGKYQTGNKAVTHVRGSRDADAMATGKTGQFAATVSDLKRNKKPNPFEEEPEPKPKPDPVTPDPVEPSGGETPDPVKPDPVKPVSPGQTPEDEKPATSTGTVASHFGTEVDKYGNVKDNMWNQEREEASKAKGGIPNPDFKPPSPEEPVKSKQPPLPGMENVAKTDKPPAPPSPSEVQAGDTTEAEGNAEAAAHARATTSASKARALGAALGGNDSRTEPHNKPYTARDTQRHGPVPRVGRDSTIDPNIARDGTSVIDAPREVAMSGFGNKLSRFLGRDTKLGGKTGMERNANTGKIDFGMERRPNEDIFRRTKRAYRRAFGRRSYVNPHHYAVGSKHNPQTDL